MSTELHRHAELLMGQADRLMAEGRKDEASKTYLAAAMEEARAFDTIPHDRPKTRAIVAVSSVSLFRKANALTEGVLQAHRFLGAEGLPDFARAQLGELLEDLEAARRLALTGHDIGADTFEWVLRGPGIGNGTARLATLGEKIDQVGKYAVRVYEYLAKVPLRRTGPADQTIKDALDVIVSQPVAGSFRFGMRLAAPTQLSLLEASTVPIEQLSASFAEILQAAGALDGELERTVVDPEYRTAFLKLIRALVPDGKEISSVEINRFGPWATSSTVLTPTMRQSINKQITARRPAHRKEEVVVDVLRGLQLNKGWIELGRDKERRCYTGEDIVLEDVVEGLINKRVSVSGYFKGNKFIIEDIVEAGDADVDSGVDVGSEGAPSRPSPGN